MHSTGKVAEMEEVKSKVKLNSDAEPRPVIQTREMSREKRRQEDMRIVRVRFKFDEDPGGTLRFSYKMHKGQPVVKHAFVDGREYELPVGLVRHINQTCRIPVHAHMDLGGASLEIGVAKWIQRASFQSIDLWDMSRDSQFSNTPLKDIF